MTRLVLFDIDGTLVRTGGAGVRAFAKTFANEFLIPDATRVLNFSGRTDPSLVRECFQKHRISTTAENFEHFFSVYPHWLAHYLNELAGGPCPGVFDVIDSLKRSPNPPTLGLLTGNIRLGAELKLRHHGLWEFFELGAFSDEHEDRHQLAAIAHGRGAEFRKAKIQPKEVLVIGDTPLDIACGKSIGAKTLGVATGSFSVAELAACDPDFTLEDLTKFSKSHLR
jgi:phosphoglycolate phosphatase-like HAD superfamily hydrolase